MMRRLLFILILALYCLPAVPILAVGQTSILPCYVDKVPSTSVTNYLGLSQGLATWSTTEGTVEGVIGGDAASTFCQNWRIVFLVAPGSGKSYTFTVRKNEADTAVAVTIADTATTGNYSGAGFSISPGDRLCVKCVPSGTPTSPTHIKWVFDMQANAANKTPWFTSTGPAQTLVGGTTQYLYPHVAGMNPSEYVESSPCPIGGTNSYLYANSDVAPGAGQTYTIMFRNTRTDTTVTCVISGASSTDCSDLTHSNTITAGDRIDYKLTASAGAATGRIRVGSMFAPTTDGYCVVWQGLTLSSSATAYSNNGASTATESDIDFPMLAGTIRNFYVEVIKASTPTAFDNGGTVTATLRKNRGAASPLPTVTITGDGTTVPLAANDTAHSYTVATDDTVCVKTVTGASSTGILTYGFVIDMGATPSGTTPVPCPCLPLLGVG